MRNSSRLARSLERFLSHLDSALRGVRVTADIDGGYSLGDGIGGCVRQGDTGEIMLGVTAILESCPIPSPELAGGVRLRWLARSLAAVVIHEAGHVVENLRHRVPQNDDRREFLDAMADTPRKPKRPGRDARSERRKHGADFARVAWHLTHRAARLGVAACPGEVFRPRAHGWRFEWHDAEKLLRSEFETLARVPIVSLADHSAPAEFVRLFTADYSAEG